MMVLVSVATRGRTNQSMERRKRERQAWDEILMDRPWDLQ
jgi:hypothetical protein